MEYIKFMQTLESHNNLNNDLPDILLLELGVGLLVRHYFLVEIAVIGELHHDAE